MRTLWCTKCGRSQPSGKHCLDCGQLLTEKVTVGVAFQPIKDCARSADALKADVRKWLARIGVQNVNIAITNDREQAAVSYKLLGEEFVLKSHRQKKFQYNLAAVEQLLHYRVLGIERGIETREQAFAGYTALPAPGEHARGAYEGLGREELKALLFLYHPDTGREPSTEKFKSVKEALDRAQ